MDQLKLKLQAYYQQYQQQDRKEHSARDMESDILAQFGLPVSKRFLQILHDFVGQRQVNDQLLDYVSRKLRTAARKYLLAPVVTDLELLMQAASQKRSPYDVLPELGFPAHDYAVFLIGELLYKRNMAPQDILEEIRKIHEHDAWEEVIQLSRENNYSNHELYVKMKKQHLRFVDDYIQTLRRKEKEVTRKPRNSSKKMLPATEGYQPVYRTINKMQVEDIVIDEQGTPSLIGKIRTGNRYVRITIGLEFSALNQLLVCGGEFGLEISNLIKKRMSGRNAKKGLILDIKAEFGELLKLEQCCMEVYKPQHKEGGKWTEHKDEFYFVDKILSKKEVEKRAKEDEVKTKIQECLELIGGSYDYYQRMRRLGITEDEAKLRAGLQDELLYKLSFYLNKLKD